MGIYQSPIYTPPPPPLPVPIPESIKSAKPSLPVQEEKEEEVEVVVVEWDHFAQFHLNFYPPLLRSSSVKKFIVGYVLPPPLSLPPSFPREREMMMMIDK